MKLGTGKSISDTSSAPMRSRTPLLPRSTILPPRLSTSNTSRPSAGGTISAAKSLAWPGSTRRIKLREASRVPLPASAEMAGAQHNEDITMATIRLLFIDFSLSGGRLQLLWQGLQSQTDRHEVLERNPQDRFALVVYCRAARQLFGDASHRASVKTISPLAERIRGSPRTPNPCRRHYAEISAALAQHYPAGAIHGQQG